jgi:hypothetical protein
MLTGEFLAGSHETLTKTPYYLREPDWLRQISSRGMG